MNLDEGRWDSEALTLELDAVPASDSHAGRPRVSAGRRGYSAGPPEPGGAHLPLFTAVTPPPADRAPWQTPSAHPAPYAQRDPRDPAGADPLATRMRERKRAMGRTRNRGPAGLGTVLRGVARSGAALRGALPDGADRSLFGPLTLSRRQALAAAVGAATVGGLAATALHGSSADPRLAGATAGTSSPSASAAGRASASAGTTAAGVTGVTVARDLDPEHLLRRVTYAPTDAMRADVAKLGIAAWLGRQMTPSAVKDPAGDAIGGLYPRLAWSTTRAHQYRRADGSNFYEFQLELATHHLGRAVWSERQLLEVMVDFWSNHLNIPAPGDKGATARHRYDADVIRKYAFGRFEDMLVASSVHPSMLDYLDNANSTNTEPNENYARELMELHTLGVHGGYTERDVKQAALLLTGWKLDDDTGMPRFASDRHYSRPVKVLGVTYANGRGSTGRKSGESFVRALARHPSTARFLARKLAIRFVADDPPQPLVDRLAATYLAGRTAITPVLRQLFGSAEFAQAGSLKLRRPYERLVATLRTLGVKPGDDPQGLKDLYYMLDTSGHKPLAWPMPNGYPDVATSWQSPAAALEQLNMAAAIVHGWWPNKLALPGPKKILPKPPRNRTAVVDAVGKKVLGRSLTDQERSATRALLSATKLPASFGSRTWEQEETVALSTTLLLTSPTFLTR